VKLVSGELGVLVGFRERGSSGVRGTVHPELHATELEAGVMVGVRLS
jgi:hypothetical protein